MIDLSSFYDLDSFLEAENKSVKKTLSNFEREFMLYKRSFNLLSETVAYLLGLTKDKAADMREMAIFLITARIIQSMQSIRDLTLKGYYYDVSVLERSLFESMGLCAYFALNKKEAIDWISGKDVEIAKIRLFGYAVKLLHSKDKDSKSIYGQLCSYVHNSIEAIASLVDASYPRGQIGLKFTPEFEKKRVHEIASYPTLMLSIVKEIFSDKLPEKKKAKIMEILKEYSTEKGLV